MSARTDGRTDWQTDKIAVSISRVSVLARDKYWSLIILAYKSWLLFLSQSLRFGRTKQLYKWLNLRISILHAQLAGRIYSLPQKWPATFVSWSKFSRKTANINLKKNCLFITVCKANSKVTQIKQQKYFSITGLKSRGYNKNNCVLYPRRLTWWKIVLLFYMCHFAMGLTHCYKTTVFLHLYNVRSQLQRSYVICEQLFLLSVAYDILVDMRHATVWCICPLQTLL